MTGPIDLGLLYWDFLPYLWGVSSRLVLLWGASWALEVQTSICFCLLLGLVQMLLDLPWSYYSTFVIEQRHGFNKQTRAVFVKDFLKSVRRVPAGLRLPALTALSISSCLRVMTAVSCRSYPLHYTISRTS